MMEKIRYNKITAEHSTHFTGHLAGILQRHYGRCQEECIVIRSLLAYCSILSMPYCLCHIFSFLLLSVCHSFIANVGLLMHVTLVNCYSAHGTVWSQTAGPWIGPHLFNSEGGASVLCGHIHADKWTFYTRRDL